jgi:cytochrome b involved in lipid metabolism
MRKLMFGAFVAFWASIVSIWSFATLAGGAGPETEDEREITRAELAGHAAPDDCWMAIDGVVYDFTGYIPDHPAPPVVMTQWCGQDATEAYRTKGYGRPHSPAADALLPQYRLGTLVDREDGSGAASAR